MIRSLIAAGMLAGVIAVSLAPAASAAPFRNCTEAREAGYTNIPSTSEYYGEHLDRDRDGIGCES
ncbi:excalibur calcium-binding domain-containing protein [Mycobacterium sp. SMC-4]|uniref:excalibur calcium-binding domain-containing protein n=1 Tax=Mycobacterium sp. SMC-4 TaxID=2857059 RepID=UPI0021B36DD1|nr:excalibur calcium-binding domain-containing protein [Mycobacterium sp. SMC-4]UXA18469.1 excalibur calcium-binding domain-containing protein [Mycobacterium sp. SMC-4]